MRGSMENSNFRPIYYLGCKASFKSVIKSAIDCVDPTGGRLLDLFSGTGVVGAALGATREVTTVDIQEYSRVICSAMLKPARLSKEEIKKIIAASRHSETARCVQSCIQDISHYEKKAIESAVKGDTRYILELVSSPPLAEYDSMSQEECTTKYKSMIYELVQKLKIAGLWMSADTTVLRYFGGVYFSFEQAAMLDSLLSMCNHANSENKDTLMAAVLSTASQIVNTVGKQFAQPIQALNKSGQVKANTVKKIERDRSIKPLEVYESWLGKYSKLPNAIGNPQALCQDYLVTVSDTNIPISVVYADPPYTRDHYSRYYHVLETMCLRDNPDISRVVKKGTLAVSRGAYRVNRHQSPFCIRSAAPAAFDAMFKAVSDRGLPMVLSYSPHDSGDGTHPRVVSITQIVDLANNYFRRTELDIVDGVTHNILNRTGLKLKTRDNAEIILKCFI